MAVRDWLQRIIGSGSDAKPGTASSHPIARPARARPGKDAVIAYAVNLSGLVIDLPEAMAFYRATFADHPSRFVTYDDLRKQGDLLDKAALKALGLRGNVKLSAQFLATLNESGRTDPLGAASVIGSTISTALCTCRDLGNMEVADIEFVEFHASPMASGPCASAARLDGKRLPLSEAQLLPLNDCTHPGACACMYQSRLTLDGDW